MTLLELTQHMLAKSPEDRPAGSTVVETLIKESASIGNQSGPESHSVFTGRRKEFADLFDFLQSCEFPALVEVAGRSGYGKSDFILESQKRFAASFGKAVFARGKCYRQENVPYPGFDELVDHLAIQLDQWDDTTVSAMLPRHLGSLIEMFPVLATVDAIAKQNKKQFVTHSREAKDQAVQSFIELLARIGDTSPLVLMIDDFQWANNESLSLIREIFASEHAPRLVMLIAYREKEMSSIENKIECKSFKSISIGPLGVDDCRELFSRAPFRIEEQSAERLQTLCDQTSGSPLHLLEVAEHLSSHEAGFGNFEYKTLIQQRINRLPDIDVRILKILSCSEFPIHRHFLEELLGDDIRERTKKLEVDRLLIYRHQQKVLELHHTQIGKAILELLSQPEKKDIHQQLANCFHHDPKSRVEQQMEQLKLAGRMETAAELMCLAAEKSIDVLAYEEAISLYRQAVSLMKEHGNRLGIDVIEKQLADVYGLAGYAQQSAAIYQELLERETNTARRFQYAKNAAYNLMTSGRVDEGTNFLEIAAEHGGVSLSSSKFRCLLGILYHRMAYLIRRKGPVKKDRRDYEVSVVLADGIFLMDPLRSAYFQSRAVLLSLRSGTPENYFQSRCEEILNLSINNDVWRKLAVKMLDQLRQEANASGDPSFLTYYEKAMSNYYFLVQQFDKVLKLNHKSLQFYLENFPGAVWHITAMWSIRFWALTFSGEFKLIGQELKVPLRRAQEQGDLNAVRSLAEAQCITLLASNDRESAEKELKIIREKLPDTRDYSVSHRNADFAESAINLYAGNFRHVFDLLTESARKSKSSETNQIQVLRLLHLHYESAALCSLIRDDAADSDRLRARLQRICKRLKKEQTDYARGLQFTIAGFLAWKDHDDADALQNTIAAVGFYEACGAGAYSHALKHQSSRSRLQTEQQWAIDCLAYAEEQQIADFDRFAALFSPPLS